MPEARAEDVSPTTYTGRVIAQRSLEAPRGGLPQESLEPLLRVRQDGVYNPQDVRRDISLLYQVGDFAQVEVDVEDAVLFDADGTPQPAVNVTYRVFPPQRIATIEIVGDEPLGGRAVLAALGVDRGDAWRPGEEGALAARLTQAYAAEGWPHARVEIVATSPPREEDELQDVVTLTVTVARGAPERLASITVRDTPALPEGRIRWLLRRRGIAAGQIATPAALVSARDALLAAARENGWFEARVALDVSPDGQGRPRLAVIVDPGRHWDLRLTGRDLPGREFIVTALELDRGGRLGRSWASEATRLVNEAAAAEGFLASELQVTVTDTPETVLVEVSGARGRRHRLREVTFTGMEGLPEDVWSDRYLRGAFREAAADTLERRRVTPETVDRALVAMEEFYRARGYLSVHLTRKAFTPGPPRRTVPVDVEVAVAPGPRAELTSVQVRNAAVDVDVPSPFEALVGAPLNPAAVDARTRALVEAHADAGYLAADAHTHLELSPDGTQASLVVDVEPGPVVYLRSVVIKGYRRTRRSVIEREVDIAPGEPLSAEAVEDIRRRLYDLGLFTRLEITPTGDEDRVKDLLITVEEKKNLYFEAGGGVATDEGIKLFGRAGHRNLLGLGHRLSTYGQIGLGWIGDGWTPDVQTPEWRAAARYEAAHVPTRGERLAIDVLFNEEQQERFYRLQRTGGGLSLLLRIGDRSRAELGYRVQLRRLLDLDPGVLIQGDPWLDEVSVDELENPAPTLPSQLRAQSGLNLSFVMDVRDDLYNPRQGGLGTLSMELADRLLTDVTFLRMDGGWTQYIPLGSVELLLRGRTGLALVPESGQTLPLEDRFRLGGGASFRGFELDSMGPANLAAQEPLDYPAALAPLVDYATRDTPAHWVPTGGDAVAVGTVELWLPLEKLGFPSLTGTKLALFTDVGNAFLLRRLGVDSAGATDSAGDAVDPLIRWSVGVGLRRSTPVGPVQVDLGFNPGRVAVREETFARVHLSLGAL